MKTMYTSFLLLAGFLLFGADASAQWKQSAGYNGDQMRSFFSYPPYVLVNVMSSAPLTVIDSLLGSTDNGQTWGPFAPNGGTPMTAVSVGGVPNLVGSASFPSGGGLTGMLAYS